MPWLLIALAPTASTDWWDFTVKAFAALAVVTGPALVIYLTRRGNQADRNTVQRTAVEELYIKGAADLIKTLQAELTVRGTELAASRRRVTTLQDEVETANKSFSAYQDQYKRLLDLLQQRGVPIPTDIDPNA